MPSIINQVWHLHHDPAGVTHIYSLAGYSRFGKAVTVVMGMEWLMSLGRQYTLNIYRTIVYT